MHIYRSNTNGNWVSTVQRYISTNSYEWVKIDINQTCRFIRMSASSGWCYLRDIRVIEEISLHGVYAARPDNPLFSRVDGFLMAPANS